MNTPLYTKVRELFDAGDETALREFVAAHITEFPEDMQADLALLFFEEAADRHAASITATAEVLSDGVATLSRINALRDKLKEQLKLEETRQKLGM